MSFLIVSIVASILMSCNSELEENKPNILFCLADDISFPHMGAYGTEWVRTPNFDKVAQNGILFMNAYTPNSKCAPSRSSILTGRNSWQLEEAANHFPFFPEKFSTYHEVLEENGYHVGYTGKGWSPGNPGVKNGKPRLLLGKNYSTHQLKPLTTGISPNDYAKNFEAFLDANTNNEPFCFWYGSLEPHRAYEFQSSLNKGGRQLSEIDKVPDFWPDNDSVRTDMLDYAMEIEHFDTHLGRMINALEERGLLENTIIVVTADNGMPFPRVKGQEYEYSNHLPMAIMWKNKLKKPGRIESMFVSFIDLAPTFLEIAGIDQLVSGMQAITGKSLLPLIENKKGYKEQYNDYVLIGKERHDVGRPDDQGYPIRGIVKGDYLYLHNFKTDRWPSGNPETGYPNADESPTKSVCLNSIYNPETIKYWKYSFGKRQSDELYNIKNDPYCVNDLSQQANYAQLLEELKVKMFEKLTEQEDPRVLGNGDVFDNYPYSGPHRNYYNRFVGGEDIFPNWIQKSDVQDIKVIEQIVGEK